MITTGFDQDIIDLQACEWDGMCVDLTITAADGQSVQINKTPIIVVDKLPWLADAPLNQPLFSRETGRLCIRGKLGDVIAPDWIEITISYH